MKSIVRNTILTFALAGLLVWAGCNRGENAGTGQDTTATDTSAMQQQPSATAQVTGLQDSTITGTLTFTADATGGLTISGQISGLKPGQHGIHVHNGTSCQEPGTHLNPTNAPHAGPDSTNRHLGDLGNIEAGQDSTANVQIMASNITSLDQIMNKPIVIHSGQDDFKTQPSGNSGTPVACGMIQQGGTTMGGTTMGSTGADTAHTGGH